MPSMASVPPFSLGLNDDVDGSFFDQLGNELDDSVCAEFQQEVEKASLCKGFEHKVLDSSDCPNQLKGFQSEKEQHLKFVNTMANLEASSVNGPDLIVPSLLEQSDSNKKEDADFAGVDAAGRGGTLHSRQPEEESMNFADHSISHSLHSEVQNHHAPCAAAVKDFSNADVVSESGAHVSVHNLSKPFLIDSGEYSSVMQPFHSAEERDKSSTKVTEVEWSSFKSAFESSNQGGFGSYSDFFSEINSIPTDQAWDAGADQQEVSDHSFTPTNFQIKELPGDPHQLEMLQSQTLEANVHQCATQYSMTNLEPSQYYSIGHPHENVQSATENREPSQFYSIRHPHENLSATENLEPSQFYSIGHPHENFQSATEYQIIQPVASNCLSSSQGTDIIHESTMANATGPHAVSTTVTDFSAGLLQGQELHQNQYVETHIQQNHAWGQYAARESCNNPSLYYHPQYPGWCYDYQTQEWREIPGYIQQGQMDITGSIAASGQLHMAVEQDLKEKGTDQLLDAYAFNNVHTHSHYGAYSQQTVSSVVDEQQYGSYLGTKQDVYKPSMEEKLTAGCNGASTENFNYKASTGLSWTAPSLVQNWQTQGLENNDKEINSTNSMFPYTYGTSQSSQPRQFSLAGDWNFGFNNESTQLYTSATPDSYASQFPNYSQHVLSQSVAHTPPKSIHEALRSSAGRPPYSNVTFGFGGKLVIVHPRDSLKLGTVVGEQSFLNGDSGISGSIEIYQLSQVVTHGTDYDNACASNFSFATLGSEVISGPLSSGSMSHKDILKWIDEKSSICEMERSQSRNSESLRILWGSLKIACQHYGKLRSSPGAIGIALQGENGPEAALAKVLELKKSETAWTDNSLWTSPSSGDCLKSLPAEPQIQASAYEMKRLLLAGKQKEALHCAQQGQLWGPALVLARQLGEKPYSDTVAEMARRLFRAGSPLQVLSLLFAGQAAEVFAGKIMSPPSKALTMANAVETPLGGPTQDGVDGLLRQWQENLAIMAANRTNGDEQVIMHLGDCLWERQGEVAAAHTCYLIADANFDSFSSNSRLCLIGADHYKYPRTFASPEAIQRTELYEYSKVMGNPQFVLVPFQPYKLVYVSMLAEVGKVAEALRYCLAVSKILKNAGRTPEVESCRQVAAALEERLRIHSQAGNISNLAPAKLMGRFLSSLDKSIHRIMGVPSLSTNSEKSPTTTLDPSMSPFEAVSQPANSFSKTNALSMVPSASMEPIYDSTNIRGRTIAPARSVSEPDFSKGTKKEVSPEKVSSSYLGRFGSQFAKAVGLVAKLNSKEAKLGEKNKFYYDENLKRWVEEGVELPPEEAALPPPPTVPKQSSQAEFDPQHAKSSSSEAFSSVGSGGHMPSSLGTPPIPPSNNQFSARARHQGVRSRYVDTFNKAESGAPPQAVQSPLLPLINSGGKSPAKFFVPAQSPAAKLDESLSDQVANGRSNDAVGILENSNADNASYSSQTENFAAASATAYTPNGYVSHLEDSSMTSSAFSFITPVEKTMKRASSADNTNAVGDSSPWKDNVSTGNSDVSKSRNYVPNGVHARAASWSDSPVSYGLAAENNSHMYSYQSEIIEDKNSMKRSLFSAMEVPSSAASYTSDIHPKPFSGVFPSLSLPQPRLIGLTSAVSMNGGSAVDVGSNLHRSSTPEKCAFDITTTADDLQEVEL